jgi:hypothetical protein
VNTSAGYVPGHCAWPFLWDRFSFSLRILLAASEKKNSLRSTKFVYDPIQQPEFNKRSTNVALNMPVVLMNRPSRSHARIELDFTKRTFVTGYILLQQSKQGLGLLRAQVNSLEVANLHLRFGLLLQGSENHKEVPHIHSHLHAVGVGFAIIGGVV